MMAAVGYRQPGARWSMLAGGAGVAASAVAFLPRGVGLLAIVFAGVGLAAGIAATVRRSPHPRLAVTGILTSILALVLAAVLVVTGRPVRDVDTGPAPWLVSTNNTAAILRDQLRVSFGTVDPDASSLLAVTLTNTRDRAATFTVEVAAFVGGTEIARDTEFLTLAGNTTQHARMFSRYLIDTGPRLQLPKAHFRVVDATMLWHPR